MKAARTGSLQAHSSKDIAQIRLDNHHLTCNKINTVKEVVGWMGAMQAQDFNIVRWAVGIRLPQLTEQMFIKSFNDAEIIRTHLLRPTWHLVSAEDISWMLELTAPQIKAKLKSRHEELALTAKLLLRCEKLIENELSTFDYLTRDEILTLLKKNNIDTKDNRASHILLYAELEGLICSGEIKDNNQSYSLLHKRVKSNKTLNREEALAKLAEKYFQSHSPATLQDFIWWSGLNVKDGRQAMESIKSTFVLEKVDDVMYYFNNDSGCTKQSPRVYLLPAYDEYIISYKDRSKILSVNQSNRAISSNGVFQPTVVMGGQVIGIWKRILRKDRTIVEVEMVQAYNKSIKHGIAKAANNYGKFLGKQVELTYNN